MKKFKKGDTVYFGTVKGEVTSKLQDVIKVYFISEGIIYFTEDGRLSPTSQVILTDHPVEFILKPVEVGFKKGTMVWFKDLDDCFWKFGYYSHFENRRHYVFNKSTETEDYNSWEIVTDKNPLI